MRVKGHFLHYYTPKTFGKIKPAKTRIVQPNRPPPPNKQELFLTSRVMEKLLSLSAD